MRRGRPLSAAAGQIPGLVRRAPLRPRLPLRSRNSQSPLPSPPRRPNLLAPRSDLHQLRWRQHHRRRWRYARNPSRFTRCPQASRATCCSTKASPGPTRRLPILQESVRARRRTLRRVLQLVPRPSPKAPVDPIPRRPRSSPPPSSRSTTRPPENGSTTAASGVDAGRAELAKASDRHTANTAKMDLPPPSRSRFAHGLRHEVARSLTVLTVTASIGTV